MRRTILTLAIAGALAILVAFPLDAAAQTQNNASNTRPAASNTRPAANNSNNNTRPAANNSSNNTRPAANNIRPNGSRPQHQNLGPYGSFYAFNNSVYQQYANPFGIGTNYFSPASFRYSSSPWSVIAWYQSRGMIGYGYSPWFGYFLQVSTPAYVGYSVTPIGGYQSVVIPSVTYSVPVNNYYAGYLNAGYLP